MKKFLLLYLCVFIYFVSFSQNEVGISFGSGLMTGKPSNVDVQSSLNISSYYHHEFRLGRKFIFEPGLHFTSARYFLDGYFSKDAGGQTVFGITPANYKQHRLDMTSIKTPLLFKYELFTNERGEGVSIGAGPYLEYILAAKQSYKIDQTNFSQKAPIDKRLQAGIAFEVSTTGKVIRNNRFSFGFGVQYQLTNFLENNNSSFKPMIFYIRMGYRF